MTTPWALYDSLIDGIPEGPMVAEAQANRWWAAVRTDSGAMGVAMPFAGGPRDPALTHGVVGRSVREVAKLAKSWNLHAAGVGVAAINAWYGDPLRAGAPTLHAHTASFFDRYRERMVTRRTVVVGHFQEAAQLGDSVTMLDREPRGTDLPDSAAEFLLPGADLVIITASSLVNKTVPRLLELAKHAEVHLVGPSTPLAPETFPACVKSLATVRFTDADLAWNSIALGGHVLEQTSCFEFVDLDLSGLEGA